MTIIIVLYILSLRWQARPGPLGGEAPEGPRRGPEGATQAPEGGR